MAGIVTALTIKLHSADKNMEPICVMFDDIDAVTDFHEDFCHAETFTASSLYSDFKYYYFEEMSEVAGRLPRIHCSSNARAFKISPNLGPKITESVAEIGMSFDSKYMWLRPGEIGVKKSYHDLMMKMLKVLDSDGIMNPVSNISP